MGSDGVCIPSSRHMIPERRRLISVVTPCFNEADNVEECYRQVAALFAERLPEYDHEHVFSDNASTDGTVEVLRRLAHDDPRIKVIINVRNYGPFRSTYNALMHTQGDGVVVLLAADLQDPPEVIVDFVRGWESGYEIVYGIRTNRQEGIVLRAARSLFYRLVTRFAEIDIPRNAGEFQFVDRRVVDALRQYDDHYPYLRGMIANSGSRSMGVPYTWRARKRGISKNRLGHLIDQALNGLISFTNIPMRMCMFVGVVLAILSVAFAVYVVVAYLASHTRVAQPGMTALISGLFFFSGVQLFFLGVIGEYVSSIHFQVRKRPLVLERELLNLEARDGRSPAARNAAAPSGEPHRGP